LILRIKEVIEQSLLSITAGKMSVDYGIPVTLDDSDLGTQTCETNVATSSRKVQSQKKFALSLFPVIAAFMLTAAAAFLCTFVENDGATAIFSIFTQDGVEWMTNEPAAAKMLLAAGAIIFGLASLYAGVIFSITMIVLIDGVEVNVSNNLDIKYPRGPVVTALRGMLCKIFVSLTWIASSIFKVDLIEAVPDVDANSEDLSDKITEEVVADDDSVGNDPNRHYPRGLVWKSLRALVYTLGLSAARIIKSIIEIKRNGPGPVGSAADVYGIPAYSQLAIVFVIATLKYNGLENEGEDVGVTTGTILTLGLGLICANFLTISNVGNDPNRHYPRGLVREAIEAIIYTLFLSLARILKAVIEIKRNGPGPMDFSTFDSVAILVYGIMIYPSAKKAVKNGNTDGWYRGVVFVYLLMALKSIFITMGRVFKEIEDLISRKGANGGPIDISDIPFGLIIQLICLCGSLSAFLYIYFESCDEKVGVKNDPNRHYPRGLVWKSLRALVYTLGLSAARIIKSIIEIKRNGPGPSMDTINAIAVLGFAFVLICYESSSVTSVSVMQVVTAIFGVFIYSVMEMAGVSLQTYFLLLLVPLCGVLMAISISEDKIKASNYFSSLANYTLFIISTLVFLASTGLSTMVGQVIYVTGLMFLIGCGILVCQTWFAPAINQSSSVLQATSAFVIIYMAQRILSSLSFILVAALYAKDDIVAWIGSNMNNTVVGLMSSYLLCGTFLVVGFILPLACTTSFVGSKFVEKNFTNLFSSIFGRSFYALTKFSFISEEVEPLSEITLTLMKTAGKLGGAFMVFLGGIISAAVLQSELVDANKFILGNKALLISLMSLVLFYTSVTCLSSSVPILAFSFLVSTSYGITEGLEISAVSICVGSTLGALACYSIGSCFNVLKSSTNERSFRVMIALRLSEIGRDYSSLSYSAGITGVPPSAFLKSICFGFPRLFTVAVFGAYLGDFAKTQSTDMCNLTFVVWAAILISLLGVTLVKKEFKLFSGRNVCESGLEYHSLNI